LGYASESDEEFTIDDVFADEVQQELNAEIDDYYSDNDMELLLETKDNLMDLGAADKHFIDRVLDLHDQKRLKAIYYPIIPNYEQINTIPLIEIHEMQCIDRKSNDSLKFVKLCINRFQDKCNDKGWAGVGYLPWKLMRSDIILEERNPKWLEIIEGPVKETLLLIEKINKAKDPITEFYNHYPLIDEDDDYFGEMAAEMENFMTRCDNVEEILDDSNNTNY